MFVREVCPKRVGTINSDATVSQAARRMRQKSMGALVVGGRTGPVEGILTEHELVIRWAADEGSRMATVSDVMSREPVAVSDTTPVEKALSVMAGQGIQRLVVTSDDGELVGVLALEDVLALLTDDVWNNTSLLRRQVHA